MNSRMILVLSLTLSFASVAIAAPAAGGFYNQGVELYKSGHFSDATDAFEQAIKKKDRAQEAKGYIERIRKETVDRIRNKALTGVSKANWQTKYFYMHVVDNRVNVGISAQEVFERQSVNFRPGAVEALNQLADALAKAEALRVQVDLINEINQGPTENKELISQQLAAVFSYLSLASRGNLPKI